MYQVRTPEFSGPFDLLLHLIVRDKVDLLAVSIAEIATGYIEATAHMFDSDLETATEFLAIASVLLELKARRLLPNDAEPDIGADRVDVSERDLLLARMVECRTFKDVGEALAGLEAGAARSHPRLVGLNEQRFVRLTPDMLKGVTAFDLRDEYLRIAARKPEPRVDVNHLAPAVMTVDEAADELQTKLSAAGRMTFRKLTAGLSDRIDVVVRFLAVLELIKRGQADVRQTSVFGDIVIAWTGERRSA